MGLQQSIVKGKADELPKYHSLWDNIPLRFVLCIVYPDLCKPDSIPLVRPLY